MRNSQNKTKVGLKVAYLFLVAAVVASQNKTKVGLKGCQFSSTD